MSIFVTTLHPQTFERLARDRRTRYLREADVHRRVKGSTRTRRS